MLKPLSKYRPRPPDSLISVCLFMGTGQWAWPTRDRPISPSCKTAPWDSKGIIISPELTFDPLYPLSFTFSVTPMVAIPHVISSLYASYAASAAWKWPGTNCNVTDKVSSLVVPDNQTQLVVPTNITLSFVGLAFGVQNYTCTPNNNFTSALPLPHMHTYLLQS